jgi:hypothetical protein
MATKEYSDSSLFGVWGVTQFCGLCVVALREDRKIGSASSVEK